MCQRPTLSPNYDLHSLPSNAQDLLSGPTVTTPAFISISIGLSLVFFVLFTLSSLSHKLGPKLSPAVDKPGSQRIRSWTGLFGFMIGLTSFLVLRVRFGKATDDFKKTTLGQRGNGSQLRASTSNGFTRKWPGSDIALRCPSRLLTCPHPRHDDCQQMIGECAERSHSPLSSASTSQMSLPK